MKCWSKYHFSLNFISGNEMILFKSFIGIVITGLLTLHRFRYATLHLGVKLVLHNASHKFYYLKKFFSFSLYEYSLQPTILSIFVKMLLGFLNINPENVKHCIISQRHSNYQIFFDVPIR